MLTLQSGHALLAGGVNQLGEPYLSESAIYDAAAAAWASVGSLVTARYGHTMTLLKDGSVSVAGGFGAAGALASAERSH